MIPTRPLLVSLAAGGLLVGAAATAGLFTAGSASAAGSPSPSPSASGPSAPGPGPGQKGQHGQHGPGMRGGFGGPGGGMRGPGGLGQGPVLHGEFVTGGQGGKGTRTVVVQNGTVSAKDGSTITVTSTDGYKVVWTLDGSTKVRTGWSQGAVKDIAQGDTVSVRGTRSGSTTTATLVAERPAGSPKAPGAPGARGSRPAPAAPSPAA